MWGVIATIFVAVALTLTALATAVKLTMPPLPPSAPVEPMSFGLQWKTPQQTNAWVGDFVLWGSQRTEYDHLVFVGRTNTFRITNILGRCHGVIQRHVSDGVNAWSLQSAIFTWPPESITVVTVDAALQSRPLGSTNAWTNLIALSRNFTNPPGDMEFRQSPSTITRTNYTL